MATPSKSISETASADGDAFATLRLLLHERSKGTTFASRELDEMAAAVEGPHLCDGCVHAERCRTGFACAALALFVEKGRISPYAPRQPSREIYARIYQPKKPQWSAVHKEIPG